MHKLRRHLSRQRALLRAMRRGAEGSPERAPRAASRHALVLRPGAFYRTLEPAGPRRLGPDVRVYATRGARSVPTSFRLFDSVYRRLCVCRIRLSAGREDSAESAVRAGLDVAQSIQAIRVASSATLELRVGIASGRVVMGEMIGGAAIDEQSVSGSVVNLANRLMAAALPGSVVLCEETRRLVGQRFALDALSPLELKGFAEPVKAWRATGEKELMSRFDAHRASGGMNEMIGRDAVLSRLAELWAPALSGDGRAVQLSGDAGIGKSRAVRAFELMIADSRVQRLDLHCNEKTSNSPLFPVAVLLRRLADVHLDDDEALCMEKAGVLLAALVPRDSQESALHYLGPLFCRQASLHAEVGDSPELVRERTIALLVDLLAAMAKMGRSSWLSKTCIGAMPPRGFFCSVSCKLLRHGDCSF